MCLRTKFSLIGGIRNYFSQLILLLTNLEIISGPIDVGDKLHFLAGVYLSAIVAKYLLKVSPIFSEFENYYMIFKEAFLRGHSLQKTRILQCLCVLI